MERDEAIAILTRKKKPLTHEAFVNAVRNRVPALALEYLMAGFDPNAPDKDGDTPLGAAVETNDAAMVRLLLERGANANDAAYFFAAVYGAPFIGSVEIIDLLVSAGCPTNFVETTTGQNALELARDMGDAKVIARLEQLYAV